MITNKIYEYLNRLKALSVVLLTCFLFAGFWFIRSWVLTGNPVYPFMESVFGEGLSQRMVGYAELPRNLMNLILLPWNISMKPALFGGEPIGCLFLVALPLLALWRKLRGIARAAFLYAVLFLLVWFYAIQHARFLFPVLPFLSFSFAALVAEWFSHKDE